MTMLTKGADVNAPWTAKEFDRMPSVHRVRWIDAEGNGRKMVVNAPLGGVKGAPPDYKDKVVDLRLRPRRSEAPDRSPTPKKACCTACRSSTGTARAAKRC